MKKGQKLTKEQRERRRKNPRVLAHLRKLSNQKVGTRLSEYQKNVLRIANTGRVKSDETRKKLSISHKGKNTWTKGMKFPGRGSGETNGRWKGGVTPKHILERNSSEYKLWRNSVFERDGFTCIWCGQHGGNLEADHIQLFSTNPELRFAIDNGRTLCVSCHRKRHQEE